MLIRHLLSIALTLADIFTLLSLFFHAALMSLLLPLRLLSLYFSIFATDVTPI